MSIKELSYLETVIKDLVQESKELDSISQIIDSLFFNILSDSKLEYLTVSSRVKSPDSLREKILRNKYYKRYPEPESLLYNLSDLIGVRVECRFSDDEKNIYKYLRKYFNKKSDNYFFYNENHNNFFLKFKGKQPQKQRNGFTIYRIDGQYVHQGKAIPFELQIKSLVNMFWGEIEHQIIYKNSDYIIEDKFLKDIMASIKNSLSMIDKQLLTVFNHFEAKKRVDSNTGRKHLEELVSKLVYDSFMRKIRESTGIVIDFKNSCETIVRYTFSINKESNDSNQMEILIRALNRINEISDEPIDFNSAIDFERPIKYKNTFSKILGEYFKEAMNNEFNWSLFFKILFTLEPFSNVRDFENFLDFLEATYFESPYLKDHIVTLEERFKDDFELVKEVLINGVALTLVSIDTIDIVYDYNIYAVNDVVENICKYIIDNIETIEDFRENEEGILATLTEEITSIF